MTRIVKITAVVGFLALCSSAWAVDSNGLVAHWKFDEGSGGTAYDSAGSNDGTLVNGPVWTTGQIDGGLEFDGTDDYVRVNDNPVLSPPKITLAAWIYPEDVSHNFMIIGKWIHTGSVAEYIFDNKINNDALRLGASFGGVFDDVHSNDAVLTAGTWQHVAVTWDGSTAVFYVNRVNAGEDNSCTGDLPDSDNDVYIGCGFGVSGRRPFGGVIDDVRIYERALSAEEVRELYLLGLPAHERAITKVEGAVGKKQAALETIEEALDEEWDAYGALEEMLESKDYGDLKKGDIVKAKQEIHSAMQHQEQSADALDKSIEGLYDALESLGWEPEPEIVYETSDDCADVLSATEESEELRFSVTVDGQYIHFEDMMVANCCKDALELDMEVEDNLITIHEIEHTTHYCLCICDYEVTATLGPFESGTYTIEVYQDFGGFIGRTTVTIE